METADADALEAPSLPHQKNCVGTEPTSAGISVLHVLSSGLLSCGTQGLEDASALIARQHPSPQWMLEVSQQKKGRIETAAHMKGPDSHGQQAGCLCEIGCVGDYHGLRSTCNVALTGDDSTRACRCLPCLAVHLATSCKRAKASASLTGLRKVVLLGTNSGLERPRRYRNTRARFRAHLCTRARQPRKRRGPGGRAPAFDVREQAADNLLLRTMASPHAQTQNLQAAENWRMARC